MMHMMMRIDDSARKGHALRLRHLQVHWHLKNKKSINFKINVKFTQSILSSISEFDAYRLYKDFTAKLTVFSTRFISNDIYDTKWRGRENGEQNRRKVTLKMEIVFYRGRINASLFLGQCVTRSKVQVFLKASISSDPIKAKQSWEGEMRPRNKMARQIKSEKKSKVI